MSKRVNNRKGKKHAGTGRQRIAGGRWEYPKNKRPAKGQETKP